MSILVATDFSPCSRTAVELATAIAQQRGIPLLLVNAVEPPPIEYATLPIGTSRWETDMVMAAEVALARDASDIRQKGLAVTTRVLLGRATDVILDSAHEENPELIVMGTHGRKGAAHVFVGSVAEGVARSSQCPVLVTREHVPAWDRWQGRAPLRLTVATDGSPAARAALSWAGTFASSRPSELSLVRVYWPPEEAVRHRLDDPWDGQRRDEALGPLLERDLQREVRALAGQRQPEVRFKVASREASEVVAEDASQAGADALVVAVPKHRSGRWAALRPAAVLRASTLPVICVPEPAVPAPQRLAQVRSILIATDLSDASRDVIVPAYSLLLAGGGRVELCTVHVLGPVGSASEVPVESPLRDEQRQAIESQLQGLIPADAEAAGITTRVTVAEGRFAAEAILAAAERLDVDLIAVGSHGRSGLKRALLGSVAEDIARRSSRPVVIVRSRYDDALI
jgi:nucleotide-binding universal stress UspA family protein